MVVTKVKEPVRSLVHPRVWTREVVAKVPVSQAPSDSDVITMKTPLDVTRRIQL